MEIKNIREFTEYCQERSEDAAFPRIVEAAAQLADASDVMRRGYGGHGQPHEEWIKLAYDRSDSDFQEFTKTNGGEVHAVLTRFWVHGSAFDRWYRLNLVEIEPVR